MSKKVVIIKKSVQPDETTVQDAVNSILTDTTSDGTSIENVSSDEHSHLPSVGDIYKGKDPRSHIYDLPDTYIGSIVPEERKLWIYNETEKKMVYEKVNFISGLYKIYDEILVNALDQDTRILENIKYLQMMKDGLAQPTKGIPNTQMTFRIMKTLKVDIDEQNNTISVMNDGDGIDVAIHPDKGIYIPEFILSNLLTSANYDEKSEDPNKKGGKIVGGRNGYGAKLTNIFSTVFVVETVDANRKLKYTQTFKNNMLERSIPIIEKYTGYPYTKITFTPDLARFKLDKLDEDTIKIMKRRVYDAGACVSNNVSIYLNGEKINNKFMKYVNLYIGETSDIKRVSDITNDRWAITACVSPDHNFTQVSFVNGISTMRGGKHVDYIADNISKKLTDYINQKNSKKQGFIQLKKKAVKNNLWIFVKATIEDPAFDTQTKECLTTKISDFGSKFVVSDDFIAKLAKTGIEERATAFSKFKESQNNVPSASANKKKLSIEKLDDAKKAGTAESHKCVLIITEGDSAKTLAVSGLRAFTEEQRKYFGIYPVKGKILNVRDKDARKVKQNEIITDLKEIMGLKPGMVFNNSTNGLRYGEIWIFTDADSDGDHIKGLLFNFLHRDWASLLHQNTSIKAIISPIVRVWKTKKKGKLEEVDEKTIIDFYSLTDYDKWKKERILDGTIKKYLCKYYKGLATYAPEDGVMLFKDLKVVNYIWDTETIDIMVQQKGYKNKGKSKSLEKQNKSEYALNLAFNKKLADSRKIWLLNYNPTIEHDMLVKEETYYDFVMNKFIKYSYDDINRTIASICDGLKESQRKILYGTIKRNLIKDIRVAQLGGYVSEHTGYHHGEVSLYATIINLAQNYVGSNNINLLVPSGQFGSRLGGNKKKSGPGMDRGAPRYIFTRMTPLTRIIFDPRDDILYKYLDDDGNKIEPVWYLPIIPMILVNGVDGIGTGFSTNIPCYNPLHCIENIERLMNGQPPVKMTPWYRGYMGEIKPCGENKFLSTGVYRQISKDQLEITEIPVGFSKTTMSYNAYALFIESIIDGSINKTESKDNDKKMDKKKMVDKNIKHPLTDKIKDCDTSKDIYSIRIVLTFYPDVLQTLLQNRDELETNLRLKMHISTDNMHAFNHLGQIVKYNSAEEILTEFYNMRVIFYAKRKDVLIANLERELQLKSAKAKFIADIHNEVITINEKINGKNKARKKSDVVKDLRAHGYPLIYNAEPKKPSNENEPNNDNESNNDADADADADANPNGNPNDQENSFVVQEQPTEESNLDEDTINKNEKGYQYLLSMRIDSLTDEMLAKLEKDRDICIENLDTLTKKTPIMLWKEDLNNFKSLYNEMQDIWYEKQNLPRSNDNKLIKQTISYHKKKPSAVTVKKIIKPVKKTKKINPTTSTNTNVTDTVTSIDTSTNNTGVNTTEINNSSSNTNETINDVDTEFGLTINELD